MKCPKCQFENPDGFKFCGCCAHLLEPQKLKTEPTKSERKNVTILFSDLSGYTSMTERLDPEEVIEIMSLIFGKIAEIIRSYDGFIERFIGDAVMAVFGVPQAHEDDPVRAIRAAIEIKAAVEDLSPQFEGKIGCTLTMHTGINTGLVVTGEVDVEKGTYGLTGDAINLASRLEGIARAGEIIVGPDTYSQAYNYFEFESVAPKSIKGKKQPVKIYKIRSAKKESFKTHRLQGLQAVLTGRDQEMVILAEAVERLKQGQGSIISISGDAGTGKSRLKKEFKDSLNPDEIQWREGQAFGYTQSIPYYPLTNLLTHAFQIEDRDPPDKIRVKVEAGLSYVLDESDKYTPYIGSLFSLDYPEIEGVNPEYWKNKLLESAQAIVSALVDRGPNVICFEDLHWADPSFIEILQRLLKSTSSIALFICTFRSHFSLFNNDLPDEIKGYYRKIHLKDLTQLDAQNMLNSLLKTNSIPNELSDFVRKKTDGNPFYLEEMINSLIESKILIRDNGNWELSRGIAEADIPATIRGVLSARVDRLDKYQKRILQEASVIGRTFLFDILKKITEIDKPIDQFLLGLENLDLIRSKSKDPELEYIFKHALTQEVVYNGLLKRERQGIHERIGLAIEQLFADRLTEFDEVLAIHFSKGCRRDKAQQYLVRSGRKALARYALGDAHGYYSQAYELLDHEDRSAEDDAALLDVVNHWSYVYWYRQDNAGLLDLLHRHRALGESGVDPQRSGMYLSWLGLALWGHMEPQESYKVLHRALDLGREANDPSVTGYAHARLAMLCSDIGLLDEGVEHGDRAMEMSLQVSNDGDLYSFARCYAAVVWLYKGDIRRVREIAEDLLEYAERRAHGRSLCMGYFDMGLWCLGDGDHLAAVDWFRKAVQVSEDPFYRLFPSLQLGMACLFAGLYGEAEEPLAYAFDRAQANGFDYLVCMAEPHLGTVRVAQGRMTEGMRALKHARDLLRERGCVTHYAIAEVLLGSVFADMATSKELPPVRVLIGNLPFLVRNVPRAARLAERHLRRAAKLFESIGSAHLAAWTNLALGEFLAKKGRSEEARTVLKDAIPAFEECGIETDLARAREILSGLA